MSYLEKLSFWSFFSQQNLGTNTYSKGCNNEKVNKFWKHESLNFSNFVQNKNLKLPFKIYKKGLPSKH